MSTPHSIPDHPESWRAVVGWEGLYEVSTLGRARSLERRVTNINGVTQVFRPVERQTPPNPNGYPMLTMSAKGRTRVNELVHRLVLTAFVGPCPDGMEGAHWDRDRSNCVLSNLRWATWEGNYDDRVRHGTDHRGDRCPTAKLSWPDVRAIRAIGRSQHFEVTAEQFGICRTTVRQVVERVTWRFDPNDEVL